MKRRLTTMTADVKAYKPTEKELGKGIRFERIRRITGYLVGDLSRWNDAKRQEEHDRVAHVNVK
jgi:hypothetical protein